MLAGSKSRASGERYPSLNGDGRRSLNVSRASESLLWILGQGAVYGTAPPFDLAMASYRSLVAPTFVKSEEAQADTDLLRLLASKPMI